MWNPGGLSTDWRMRISFVLVGAIFVICQIIIASGTRTETERAAIAADHGPAGIGWSAMPAETDGVQTD